MSRLENELAVRLLQRTSQSATSTSAGLAFYPQAQLAFCHADGAVLATCESRSSRYVSVGMAPSIASVLGMSFINAIWGSYGDVRLYVMESLSGSLEWMINTRQTDLAVMFQKEKTLCWSAIPTLEERLFLIGTHALLVDIAGDNIAPAQLASIPLMTSSPGHGLCGRLEAICQEHALNIEIATEIDGLVLLMRVMCSGIGATFQPGAAIPHLDKKVLRMISVHSPIFSRPNLLMGFSDDGLTPAGLVARMVLTKVVCQPAEAGSWPDTILYNN